MGADFMVTYADVTEPKEHWDEIISSVSDQDIFDSLNGTSALWGYESEEYWEDYESGELGFDKPTQKLFDALRNDLREAFGIAYDPGRDCSQIVVGGRTVTVTGGFSWGDDPTDSFLPLGVVYEFQYWYENVGKVTA